MRKAGATHIAWASAPTIKDEDMTSIKSALIAALSPTANRNHPTPKNGLIEVDGTGAQMSAYPKGWHLAERHPSKERPVEDLSFSIVSQPDAVLDKALALKADADRIRESLQSIVHNWCES